MTLYQEQLDKLTPTNADSTLEEIFKKELLSNTLSPNNSSALSTFHGPAERLAPQTYDDLKSLMVKSHREKKRIKPYGTGYAFSTILDTSGIQYDLSQHLNRILDTESELLSSQDEYRIRFEAGCTVCLLYTSPSPRDQRGSRMPSSA